MNKKLYYLTWIWTDLWIWESNPNDNDYFVLVKRLTYTVPGTITRSRKVCNITEDRNIISQHYIVSIHTDIDHLLEIAVLEVL